MMPIAKRLPRWRFTIRAVLPAGVFRQHVVRITRSEPAPDERRHHQHDGGISQNGTEITSATSAITWW